MQVGVTFPQTEIGTDPIAIRDYAQAAEDLGYEHLLAYDHVLGADPTNREGWRGYTYETMFHEPLTLFGYLAAVTQRLELVTGVLVLPQRQTALVAKQAAEVDVLSGGRMRLGVGVGWNAVEYEALGEDFGNRGARSEEQVAVLRALWADPTVTFDGHWHRITDAGINPLPPRRRIPVWFGGSAEATLRRVGTIGDGWLPQGPPDERARAAVARIHEHAVAAGRAPSDVGLEPRLTLARTPRDGWAAHVTGWRDIGATHLCVDTMGSGFATADDHVAALSEVMEALTALD